MVDTLPCSSRYYQPIDDCVENPLFVIRHAWWCRHPKNRNNIYGNSNYILNSSKKKKEHDPQLQRGTSTGPIRQTPKHRRGQQSVTLHSWKGVGRKRPPNTRRAHKGHTYCKKGAEPIACRRRKETDGRNKRTHYSQKRRRHTVTRNKNTAKREGIDHILWGS